MKLWRQTLLQSFNPLSLAPLVMLDADNLLGTGTANNPANGAAVTAWNDLSGNGVNFTPGSSPTYKTNQMNGHAIVDFNGTSNHLISSVQTYDSGTPITMFAISGYQNTPVGSTFLGCHGFSPVGGWGIGANSAAFSSPFHFTSFTISDYSSTNLWDTSGYDIMTMIYNGGTTLSFYKNGSNLQNIIIDGPLTISFEMFLGRYGGAAIGYWPGQLNFLFLKYGTITAAQLTLMHGWLKARKGI